MKGDLRPSYGMSPNELERFLKEERAKNRKLRLQQVLFVVFQVNGTLPKVFQLLKMVLIYLKYVRNQE